MEFQKKLREDAKKVLKNKKSTKKEIEMAKTILALDTVIVLADAQRTHWLSAFAEQNNLLKDGRKTLKKEQAFLESSFKASKKAKIV